MLNGKNKCLECGKEHNNKKFCSRQCANKINNKVRMTDNVKNKISNTLDGCVSTRKGLTLEQFYSNEERVKKVKQNQSIGNLNAWNNERKQKQSENFNGSRNPCWRGGKYILGNRVYILCPDEYKDMAKSNGYVFEHRLVMAKKIGRSLTKKEVVHHIDGDSTNNKIKNLKLFANNGEHIKYEVKNDRQKFANKKYRI